MTGTDVAEVLFYVDGELRGIDNTSGSLWTYGWSGDALGEHTLVAKAHYADHSLVESAPVKVIKVKRSWRQRPSS